jgi:AcrR family transcriptional regulator
MGSGMSQTKQRLLTGALAAIGEHGITGVSARTIAAAGVNQALVFHHHGSVDDLLATACLASI